MSSSMKVEVPSALVVFFRHFDDAISGFRAESDWNSREIMIFFVDKVSNPESFSPSCEAAINALNGKTHIAPTVSVWGYA